jgi:hypothetical protein
MDRYRIPASAIRVTSKRCETVLWAPVPSVAIMIAVGHGDAEMAPPLAKEIDRLMAGRRDVLSFFDGAGFTGYDPDFRAVLGVQARRQLEQRQVKQVCVLTRSKIVAMGAAVVGLAIGSKHEVFSDVKAFDKRIVAAGAASALNPLRNAG